MQRQQSQLEAALAEKATRQRLARALQDTGSGQPKWSRLPPAGWVLVTMAASVLRRELLRNARRLWAVPAAVAVVAVAVFLVWRYFSATVAAIVAAATATATLLTSMRTVVTKIRGVAERARNEVAQGTTALDDALRKDEVELRQLNAARRLGDYLLELRSPQRYEQYRGLLGRIHQDLKQRSLATPSSPLASSG